MKLSIRDYKELMDVAADESGNGGKFDNLVDLTLERVGVEVEGGTYASGYETSWKDKFGKIKVCPCGRGDLTQDYNEPSILSCKFCDHTEPNIVERA